MTVILFLLFSLSAFAQQFDFTLDGSFTTKAAPGASTPTTVNYSISWNETSTSIQGIYKDNYFSNGTPQNVSGTIGPDGRSFSVIYPSPVYGVRQLILKSGSGGLVTGTISVRIRTLSSVGGEIDNQTGFALVAAAPQATTATGTGTARGPESAQCTVGFGAITRMCGLYRGTINESIDNANQCNLAGTNIRLELGVDSVFRFYPDYVPGLTTNPVHSIGAFLPSPTVPSIMVSRRDCGFLPGTAFPTTDCKTLTLTGTFSTLGPNIQFNGNYSISNDGTGSFCNYSMTLNREVGY